MSSFPVFFVLAAASLVADCIKVVSTVSKQCSVFENTLKISAGWYIHKLIKISQNFATSS